MRLAWGQIPGPEATGSPGSVAGAHVIEQAVHAEGDERGESHADAHDPEHATGDRGPVPPLGRETERDPAPGASCERDWLTYGRPTAAGGIAPPPTPATTTRVTT